MAIRSDAALAGKRTILTYAPEMAAYGGMEQHVCSVAECCAAAGFRSLLMTTSRSLNGGRRARLKTSGVDLIEMNVDRGAASGFRKMLWVTLMLLFKVRGADLAYTNGQSGLVRVVVSHARKRGNCPVVHHHHTAADEGEIQTWTPLYRRVLTQVNYLLGCSKSTRRNLARETQRSDVSFLPYITSPVCDLEAVSENPSPGSVRIAYFGRLVSTKGVDTICELSQDERLASVQWEVFGEGPDFPAEYFRRFPRVSYKGSYRNQREYRRALGSVDAVVLLSRHNEGMPLSLIEATGYGRSWIASDRGGISELAAPGLNVLVVPADASKEAATVAISAFVTQLRSGPERRQAQRELYDSFLLPDLATKMWQSYMLAKAW